MYDNFPSAQPKTILRGSPIGASTSLGWGGYLVGTFGWLKMLPLRRLLGFLGGASVRVEVAPSLALGQKRTHAMIFLRRKIIKKRCNCNDIYENNSSHKSSKIVANSLCRKICDEYQYNRCTFFDGKKISIANSLQVPYLLKIII